MQPSWKASPLLFLSAAIDGKIDTHQPANTFSPTPTLTLSGSVVVAVVNIRHVNMTMHYWLVPVPMRIRLSWWIGRQMVV